MARKKYDWESGAVLEEHTRKKHKVLKEYFRNYLLTRCQHPKQEKFRIIIVDGFSGAGLYKCGTPGSPIIFVETLIETSKEINIARAARGLGVVQIESLLILNDQEKQVINQLKKNISPYQVKAREESQNLLITIDFYNDTFENTYPEVRKRLLAAKCANVFFNLDQCGYSTVTTNIIKDIVSNWKSAEVLLTFMIDSILAFISPHENKSSVPLEKEMQEKVDCILKDRDLLTKQEWLGEAEKIIYTVLKNCAPYVSPFSINNPDGWRYWLMHFANNYRAREVYNDVLHENCGHQAHFGKPGLNMLSYDPHDEKKLYLFDDTSREDAKIALYDDIPRHIAESGDTILMSDFCSSAYNETPAHSDDIRKMIMKNPDIEVITSAGGTRQQFNTITPNDTLKLKYQKSIIFTYS